MATSSNPASGTHSKEVSWYVPGPPTVPENLKDILANWSGINPDNQGIEKHVESIFVYLLHMYKLVVDHPCSLSVGGYLFVGLGLAAHPSFDDVVATLKSSHGGVGSSDPIFLDLGCCVGQDMRSLVYADVPGPRLVGVDIDVTYLDIGYELFRDRNKLGSQFIVADIFTLEQPEPPSANPNGLSPLIGRVSILWASAFLHLWRLSGQKTVCRKMLLLMRNEPGVRILGRQAGSKIPAEVKHVTNPGEGLMYRHNPETLKKMWCEILDATEDQTTGILRSTRYGSWRIHSFFEGDGSAEAQEQKKRTMKNRKTDTEWQTKVVVDSEGKDDRQGNAEGAEHKADGNKMYFLFWEIERIG